MQPIANRLQNTKIEVKTRSQAKNPLGAVAQTVKQTRTTKLRIIAKTVAHRIQITAGHYAAKQIGQGVRQPAFQTSN